MTRIVVDASVAAKWILDEEEHRASADRLLNASIERAAPDLLYLEIGNALWKHARRRTITIDRAAEALEMFMALAIEIHETRPLMHAALEIALTIDRTVYDSSYLALAMRLDCPLVTADRKFHDAVIATPLASHIRWIADPL